MSEPAKNWISSLWPEDASLNDHLRSLRGVVEILDEYVENRWQDGKHEGLLLVGRSITQATNAIEARIGRLVCNGKIGRDEVHPRREGASEETGQQSALTRDSLDIFDSEGGII